MDNLLIEKKLYPFQKKAINSLENFYNTPGSPKGYLHIATGGGKTLVSNYFLVKNYLLEDKKVLWLAWDWNLLEQARSVLTKEFRDKFHNAYIANSKNNQNKVLTENLPEFDESIKFENNVQIIYSTMQTFRNKTNTINFIPDIVVIDEAHHGRGGNTEVDILNYIQKNKIPLLGLSGTPKKRKGWGNAFSVSFKELVDNGHLAKPIFHSVSTGIKIDATKKNARDDFNLVQKEVYSVLRDNIKRNKQIVDSYNSAQHGKTIVFAIDINHANTLAKMFYAKDIHAFPIHSQRNDSSDAIESFRNNDFEVAIAVNKLNQGIDIPDVKTLFITRPVTSDIMYSQMVGRGARICKKSGKITFLVVDFEDNFIDEELQRMIFEPKGEYFGAEASKSIYNQTFQKRSYEKRPDIIFPYDLQIYRRGSWRNYEFIKQNEAIELPVLTNQTFGVELELTTTEGDEHITDEKKWRNVANQIYSWMEKSLPQNLLGTISPHGEKYQRRSYKKFNLVYDGSCGWEIVSPVLCGTEGFAVLNNFLDKFSIEMKKITPKVQVNHETGFHVHFGFSLDRLDISRFLCNIYDIETYVACLLPPSRFNEFDGEVYDETMPNPYCVPFCVNYTYTKLKRTKNKKDLRNLLDDDGEIDRYMSVNFKNILQRKGIGTIEVRLHSGTFSSEKVLSWISLWMGLLDSARTMVFDSVIDEPEEINPTLNEFRNLKKTFIEILPRHREMIIKSLVPRSREVRKLWKKNHLFT
jgi:superfamily II DNA or RNA helicase